MISIRRSLFLIFLLSCVSSKSYATISPFVNLSANLGAGGLISTVTQNNISSNIQNGTFSFAPGVLAGVGIEMTVAGFLYTGFEVNGGSIFTLQPNVINSPNYGTNFTPSGAINGLLRLGVHLSDIKVYAVAGVGTLMNYFSSPGALLQFSMVQMHFGLGAKYKLAGSLNLFAEMIAAPNLFFNGVNLNDFAQVFSSANAFYGRLGIELSF